MTTHSAVRLAAGSDRDVLRDLYDGHCHRIYRLAYRYTRSASDAEDVMQETFVRAFRSLRRGALDSETSLPAWLSSICIHCAIDHLRRMKRRRNDAHVTLADLPCEPESPNPGPERAVAARQADAWIRNAVRALSARQHVLFQLRYGEHLTVGEIAAQMHCSESSVKTHLARAVAKLRKALRPVWEGR